MEKSSSSERIRVMNGAIVLHSECPRCGKSTHIECIYPAEDNGRLCSFHFCFCFSCGLVVKLFTDEPQAAPIDEIKEQIQRFQRRFSGLMCIRTKDGVTEYQNVESPDIGGEEEVVSRLLRLQEDQDVDHDASYIANGMRKLAVL